MLMRYGLELAEQGLLPDAALRMAIRHLIRLRLSALHEAVAATPTDHRRDLIRRMNSAPIALSVETTNHQHYEVPAEFFRTVLGQRLKYSCGLWSPGVSTLNEAEEAMQAMTADRAGIEDGMSILDLGCGWGSLSLWLAERFPNARILAVSNSHIQRQFIESERDRRHLPQLSVMTSDMNHFTPDRRFDCVISIEMFEHMRNFSQLLSRIAQWLSPGGRLFVHIFCHRSTPYFFETNDDSDWMAQHFFTGGLMPSFDLFDEFRRDLVVEEQWAVNGRHYARTLEAWLVKLDACRADVQSLFARTYGDRAAARWVQRWRMFFLACAELFAYRDGEEWLVGHYRLRSPRSA